MRVLVPKEIKSGEKRVALVPDIISKLTRAGLTVAIESGAGTDSQATDSEFQAAGAEIIATSNIQSELGKADVVASGIAPRPASLRAADINSAVRAAVPDGASTFAG